MCRLLYLQISFGFVMSVSMHFVAFCSNSDLVFVSVWGSFLHPRIESWKLILGLYVINFFRLVSSWVGFASSWRSATCLECSSPFNWGASAIKNRPQDMRASFCDIVSLLFQIYMDCCVLVTCLLKRYSLPSLFQILISVLLSMAWLVLVYSYLGPFWNF